MQNNSIKLLNAFGVLLIGAISAVIATSILNHSFLNYREQDISTWIIYSLFITPLALYFLGVYIVILLVGQALRRVTVLELPLLVIGCILILVFDCLLIESAFRNALPRGYTGFWALVLPNLLCCLGFLIIVTRLRQPRLTGNLMLSVLRALILWTIASALVIANYSDFPGVAAPVEVRQLWAHKEFSNYAEVGRAIERCPAVVERVGTVRSVAPTQGKNYVVAEPGSSGHHGEFTLEVVGSRGTGVANFEVHIATSVAVIQFTSQDKTEALRCR